MSSHSKVSIVMPCYNVEQFLSKSILSCYEQHFDSELELIAVNDGSTDNTLLTLEQYSSLFKRPRFSLIVVDQENSGPSKARNKGFEHATGEYVLFLDSDDSLTLDAVSKTLNTFKRELSDVVYSDHAKVTPEGKKFALRQKNDYSLVELLSGMYIGHLRAFSSDSFSQMEGFDEQFTYAEDYDLLLKYATSNKNITHIPEALYNYTSNPHGLIGSDVTSELLHTSAQTVIRDAFQRLGISNISFSTPWKDEQGVTRYLSELEVESYLKNGN